MSGPYYADATVTIHHGDCLDVLRELPDASVDSVVTDPPYGLEFMGKAWDSFKATGTSSLLHSPKDEGREFTNDSGHMWDNTKALPWFPSAGRPFQAWCELWATECLRVLKPGGHLLAFGGTRTSHRLACAIEDAGFEIRDSIAWLYGSGFPKSLNVSKQIDGLAMTGKGGSSAWRHANENRPGAAWTRENTNNRTGQWVGDKENTGPSVKRDSPATPDAARWQGWGTALKPAHEPVVVARKPLSGTVAANVLAHGTGALNIDGCRVGDGSESQGPRPGHEATAAARYADAGAVNFAATPGARGGSPSGRWPANVVLDESQAAALDAQSGDLTSGANPTSRGSDKSREAYGDFLGQEECTPARGADTGGASRFFYTAKASSSERIRLPRADGSAELFAGSIRKRCTKCGKQEVNMPGAACACPEPDFQPDPAMSGHIAHPTVKPLDLMRWLVRLVTPPDGTVLEPFAGSGTTVEACILEGFRCIAIEREADYLPLIVQRVNRQRDPIAYTAAAGEDLGLFGTFDFGDAS